MTEDWKTGKSGKQGTGRHKDWGLEGRKTGGWETGGWETVSLVKQKEIRLEDSKTGTTGGWKAGRQDAERREDLAHKNKGAGRQDDSDWKTQKL